MTCIVKGILCRCPGCGEERPKSGGLIEVYDYAGMNGSPHRWTTCHLCHRKLRQIYDFSIHRFREPDVIIPLML